MEARGATRDEALNNLADMAWTATDYLVPIFRLFGWTYGDWATGKDITPDRDRLLSLIYNLCGSCRREATTTATSGRLLVTISYYDDGRGGYWGASLMLNIPNEVPTIMGIGVD